MKHEVYMMMRMHGDKQFWGMSARIYDRMMKKDASAYDEMYALIQKRLSREMSVLELATGTGLIAQHIASSVKTIEATDFSQEMILQAKKKHLPSSIHFSVQDACSLPYEKESFNIVIISNALHIMPAPQKALAEIQRVLKKDGLLIAPNFAHKELSLKGKFRVSLMRIAGFHTYSIWAPKDYLSFLERNGFSLTFSKVLKASFPLVYAEAIKAN